MKIEPIVQQKVVVASHSEPSLNRDRRQILIQPLERRMPSPQRTQAFQKIPPAFLCDLCAAAVQSSSPPMFNVQPACPMAVRRSF
ncbi:MAG: hypothetical protein ACRDBP_11855 [Luteolibacter sp.]